MRPTPNSDWFLAPSPQFPCRRRKPPIQGVVRLVATPGRKRPDPRGEGFPPMAREGVSEGPRAQETTHSAVSIPDPQPTNTAGEATRVIAPQTPAPLRQWLATTLPSWSRTPR